MAEITDFDPTDANNTGRWPENMQFSAVNDAGRADEGILARWFRDWNGSIVASGSANAFAITSNRTIASLANNTVMAFTANHTIDGAATLNLNTLGAKSIKRFNGNALASGDIVSGQPVMVIYKSSPDVWFMMSAAAALTGNMFADFDENASPGDPAADDARLYAYDDGGETVLAFRDSAGVISDLRIATQSQMETPNDGRIVRADRQHHHPGHPKSWVNFNGTGDYTVNQDTAFSSTSYCAVGGIGGSEANADDMRHQSTAPTASAFRFTMGTGGALVDPAQVHLAFLGDHA